MISGINISSRLTASIATLCLLLILSVQSYLVYDYFQTTRKALVRETDAIMEEVFRNDLNKRVLTYKHIIGEDTVTQNTAPPPKTATNTVGFDMRAPHVASSGNVVRQLDLIMNSFVSKIVAPDVQKLDLGTRDILNKRQINSTYLIRSIEMPSGRTLQNSKQETFSLFTISSQPLIINLDNSRAFQLVLINPLGIVMQRMGTMLVVSLVLSIICLGLIWYLQLILAQQKQLVAFKNDFLSTIAHELKRPVAALSANLDSLRMPEIAEEPTIARSIIDNSIAATSEMESTIRMIVSLARAEEGMLQLMLSTIQLEKMLEDLGRQFSLNCPKQLSLKINDNNEQHKIRGDEQLIRQCFANLIDNSIKYSSESVEIQIELTRDNEYERITISDNGWGIPTEKLQHIFDKYNRAHADVKNIHGYGIGLNYVKTIIEKHQGTIEIESKEKQGTTFILVLPVNR